MGQHRGSEKSGFADADHRRVGERARRVEPGVVEACDHMRIRAFRFAFLDALEQSRHREGVIVGALDRGRAERGFDGADDRVRPRSLCGGGGDDLGHRRGRVRVDDIQSSWISPRPRVRADASVPAGRKPVAGIMISYERKFASTHVEADGVRPPRRPHTKGARNLLLAFHGVAAERGVLPPDLQRVLVVALSYHFFIASMLSHAWMVILNARTDGVGVRDIEEPGAELAHQPEMDAVLQVGEWVGRAAIDAAHGGARAA